MPRYVIRKSLPQPTPARQVVAFATQAPSILRQGVGKNLGPYNGAPMGPMPQGRRVMQPGEGTDACRRPQDVVRNLFTDPQTAALWQSTVASTVAQAKDEATLRQALFTDIRTGNLEPIVGRTLLRRGVSLWRHQLTKRQ